MGLVDRIIIFSLSLDTELENLNTKHGCFTDLMRKWKNTLFPTAVKMNKM